MLLIKCDYCDEVLEHPGALVFSPPVDGKVSKLHLCIGCWNESELRVCTLRDFINAESGRPKTQGEIVVPAQEPQCPRPSPEVEQIILRALNFAYAGNITPFAERRTISAMEAYAVQQWLERAMAGT